MKICTFDKNDSGAFARENRVCMGGTAEFKGIYN